MRIGGFIFLAYSLIFLSLGSLIRADLDSEYTNSAYLDEAKTYKLYWKINNDQKSIRFAVRVNTLGWIGFGISAGKGSMVDADVVIGWVKENKGYLKDRYAEAETLPPIDEKQDYTLLAARETNSETIIEFSRLWDTCDVKDKIIEEGTVRVIYAYHTNDPVSETKLLKHTKRGSRSLILLNVLTSKPSLPDDIKYFEIKQNDTAIPNKDTTYYCKSFEFPQFSTKKHVVKIEPVVSSDNEGLVHHMLVYECKSDFPRSNLSVSGACYTGNMPPDVSGCVGSSVVASWGIGGGSFYFPSHTGLAIGAGVGPRYVVLEVHYDNPEKKSGLRDSSGLRFLYTETLRQYDAGILWAGWDVSSAMMIPPYQENWMTTGYCSGVCTKDGFKNSSLPDKGINIFATLLHSHLQGVSLWARHVRNATELSEIARDDHYDFNYQEYHISRGEKRILPGDDIIVQCRYQTKDKTIPVTGGLRTSEEMCMAFLYYYPLVDLNKCLSINYGISKFFNKNFVVNGSVVGYPPAQWTQNMTDELRESYNESEVILTRCRYQADVSSPMNGLNVPKPIVQVPYKKPARVCPTISTTHSTTSDVNSLGQRPSGFSTLTLGSFFLLLAIFY